MRLVNAAMAVLFLAFAVLQYNDPDALLWIAAYVFAALVCLLAAAGRRSPLPAAGLIVYGAGFVLLAPAIDAGWWHSEKAREALGLLVAALWMGVLVFVWRRASPL